MTDEKIQHVAIAGAGRIGLPIVRAILSETRHRITILTRSRRNLPVDLTSPEKNNNDERITICEVDYTSPSSLLSALRGKGINTLVCTLSMSAIPLQPVLIDACISAGVEHYIPAEYTMATRDPGAQWLPIYSSVLAIQKFLSEEKAGQIGWTAVNCGALMEFVFDAPFMLDFDTKTAILWDGGDEKFSLSTIPLLAKAVASLVGKLHRIPREHTVQVHGALVSQRDALAFAVKHTPPPPPPKEGDRDRDGEKGWTVKQGDSAEAIERGMARIASSGAAAGPELVGAMIEVAAAATLGKGHFAAGYEKPDNEWLGVEMLPEGVVEEAIRKRIVLGPWALQTGTADVESIADVAGGLAEAHNNNKT